jgi:hypothetical protein
MLGENLTAIGQPVPGNDKQRHAARFQPTIGVAQKCLLGATTVSRPQCPIIGWIQIQEAKALDRALHFQRISLDNVGDPLPGLLCAVGIKLDAVANDLSIVGDDLERHAIANTRVDCRGRSI